MENALGFQIQHISVEKGNGMFALQPYVDGSIIFEERPLVCCQFAWNADYGYAACDNCLRPLETAEENVRRLTAKPNLVLPFPELCETPTATITSCPACGMRYCSPECLSEAMKHYHRILCLQSPEKPKNHPLVQLKEKWQEMHYPPETTSIMLLARMVALVNQAEDPSVPMSKFNAFCHETTNEVHEVAHNLLGEQFVHQIDELRALMENCFDRTHCPQWFTPDGFRSLLALVGTNGQGIGTSAFSRWVRNVTARDVPEKEGIQMYKYVDSLYDDMDEAVGPFLNNEGSGLYVQQSSINHSCSPNSVVEFPHSNSTLVVRALRKIEAGEEITISYLEVCELERSRHSRQKALRSLYMFHCRCEKCLAQADEADVTSEDEDEDEEENERMSQ